MIALLQTQQRLFLNQQDRHWHRGVTRLDGASLPPPWLNLRSFGSKFTVLKKVLVTLSGLFDSPRSHSAPQ